jgi:hypothetical protein
LFAAPPKVADYLVVRADEVWVLPDEHGTVRAPPDWMTFKQQHHHHPLLPDEHGTVRAAPDWMTFKPHQQHHHPLPLSPTPQWHAHVPESSSDAASLVHIDLSDRKSQHRASIPVCWPLCIHVANVGPEQEQAEGAPSNNWAADGPSAPECVPQLY